MTSECNMIARNTPEWSQFIHRIESVRLKSNREVLCVKCWQMFNCKQKVKHAQKFPDHQQYVLTSSQYAFEAKIVELAIGCGKLVEKEGI